MFQTLFVRQNTPHPKELKAKAHKLFGGKGKVSDGKGAGDEEGMYKGLYRRDADNCKTGSANYELSAGGHSNEQDYDENEDEYEGEGGGDEQNDNDLDVRFPNFDKCRVIFLFRKTCLLLYALLILLFLVWKKFVFEKKFITRDLIFVTYYSPLLIACLTCLTFKIFIKFDTNQNK